MGVANVQHKHDINHETDVMNTGNTHPMILISRHCHELGLGENECLEVFCRTRVFTTRRIVNDMESRLVPMH